MLFERYLKKYLTLYLIEAPFDTLQTGQTQIRQIFIRAALSGSTLFAYGIMIRYYPSLVVLTSTNVKVIL